MTRSSSFDFIQQFSQSAASYILENIPAYIGLAVLKFDKDGRLQKWYGPCKKYIEITLYEGLQIQECAPFFYGKFPPLINPLVLSHIQINDNQFAEIHILSEKNQAVWVFIVDQTVQVEFLRPFMQFYNQERLSNRIEKKQANAQGALTALYLLDYLTFEKTTGGYNLIGDMPVWVNSLENTAQYIDKNISLLDAFPLMEVFQEEAREVWESHENGKLLSDIWEETTQQNNRMLLQALALQYETNSYLLIKPLNLQQEYSENLFQKAREQNLMFSQLAQTEKKLKQLLEFKDQFVSIISHDLRSPIGAVIGIANLLLSDKELTDKLNAMEFELLTDIRNEMIRLLDYNDKLFQWSNLELGNFKIVKKPIEAKLLAHYVEKMQAVKMNQKNITFIAQITDAFTIFADETLLINALNNLIGNSIKFTPNGGSIILKFLIRNGIKTITIQDTGIGMTAETCQKLFAGFTRKTTMGTYGEKGTGLGLGIVKKIIDAHEFSIDVKSEIGSGTEFIICLQPSCNGLE